MASAIRVASATVSPAGTPISAPCCGPDQRGEWLAARGDLTSLG